MMHPLALLYTLVLTAGILLTTATRIREELLHPIVVLNAIVAFYILGPAWKLTLVGGYWTSHANPGGQLAQALAVIGLSYVAILWAYRRTEFKPRLTALVPKWRNLNHRMLYVLGLVGFSAGVLFYLYFVFVNGGFIRLLTVSPRTAFTGAETARFKFLGYAGTFAGLATVLSAYRPRVVKADLDDRDRVFIGALIVITFLIAISLRSRMNIVVPAAYLLLYAESTDRLPRRQLVTAGAVVFLFGVGYTFIESLVSSREANLGLILLGGLFNTLRLEILMKTISQVPGAHPYQLGATFLRSFGIVWPGAPMGYGNQLELIVIGEDRPHLSFPAFMLGEFWLNFGLIGVLLGSAVFGWALKAVYSLRRLTRSPIAMSLYPLLFLGIIAAYPTSISWVFRAVWIRIVVPVAIAIYVACRVSGASLPLQMDRVFREQRREE
jgi:hypothetical protein